jgi:hypothetical protein
MLTPKGELAVRAQGIEGVAETFVSEATALAGAGARKRGAPQSPVFCGAKNAPKCGFEKVSYI